MFENAYANKTVLLTGHTGFKGAWLSEWLLALGANVVGVALEPNTSPSLFRQLRLAERIQGHHVRDIRDAEGLAEVFRETEPDFVFHLAAQPLVRTSYETPLETYDTNLMGTVNLLNALRNSRRRCAAVFVTTDKVYENSGSQRPYHEDDRLGGFDPYSSSKACAELAISSFRRSFFNHGSIENHVAIASARAGNVIGGGDWAKDRIVPDIVRAFSNGERLYVRNPDATRPWQHVLESLSGYLTLGAKLSGLSRGQRTAPARSELESAFNFGPSPEADRTVGDLLQECAKHIPFEWRTRGIGESGTASHEAALLQLDIDKARKILDWTPKWSFETTVERTMSWYAKTLDDDSFENVLALTRAEMEAYERQA